MVNLDRLTLPSLLLQANVNAKGGSHQRTPLHYASLNNHVGVAKLLLDGGANEYARDSGGYTPLNLSLGGEMCKLLHKVNCAQHDYTIRSTYTSWSYLSNRYHSAWLFRVVI